MLTKQEQRQILGKKVETLRKAKGMTQEELALKSGFKGRAAINGLEKGRSGINVARLPDLARALGVDPLVLFDDDKQPDFTLEDKLVEKVKRLGGQTPFEVRTTQGQNVIKQGVCGN